jgi:uncharacterized protein with PQ loop repeat
MTETIFQDSFHGFVDYSNCFPDQEAIWLVVGAVIFVGTWISLIPQYQLIVANRSNFGLDSIALFAMVFGQFILVANILSLRTPDFIGWLQYPFTTVIGRSMTFINAAANWLSYLPCSFLALVFFDIEPRERRDEEKIKREHFSTRLLIVVGPSICTIAMILYFGLGAATGFESSATHFLGQFYGGTAALLWVGQYLPQIWTTLKLKDGGNLSIINLLIQAPGSMINAVFMWVGQSDHWTTWVSSFLLSIEQFVLLSLVIFFRCRKARVAKENSLDDQNEEGAEAKAAAGSSGGGQEQASEASA